MIKRYSEKMTPKEFSQHHFYSKITEATDYWTEMLESHCEDMTEREKELVQDQLEKMENRLVKLLGFEPRK